VTGREEGCREVGRALCRTGVVHGSGMHGDVVAMAEVLLTPSVDREVGVRLGPV
jgi:hypothetical protein